MEIVRAVRSYGKLHNVVVDNRWSARTWRLCPFWVEIVMAATVVVAGVHLTRLEDEVLSSSLCSEFTNRYLQE